MNAVCSAVARSKKYLPLYLAEFTFRHDHRKDLNLFDSSMAG